MAAFQFQRNYQNILFVLNFDTFGHRSRILHPTLKIMLFWYCINIKTRWFIEYFPIHCSWMEKYCKIKFDLLIQTKTSILNIQSIPMQHFNKPNHVKAALRWAKSCHSVFTASQVMCEQFYSKPNDMPTSVKPGIPCPHAIYTMVSSNQLLNQIIL